MYLEVWCLETVAVELLQNEQKRVFLWWPLLGSYCRINGTVNLWSLGDLPISWVTKHCFQSFPTPSRFPSFSVMRPENGSHLWAAPLNRVLCMLHLAERQPCLPDQQWERGHGDLTLHSAHVLTLGRFLCISFFLLPQVTLWHPQPLLKNSQVKWSTQYWWINLYYTESACCPKAVIQALSARDENVKVWMIVNHLLFMNSKSSQMSLGAGFCLWISELAEGNVKWNVDRQLPLEYISMEAREHLLC